MTRRYPETTEEFAKIAAHLTENIRFDFADKESSLPLRDRGMTESVSQSLQLFRQGRSLEAIAAHRNLNPGTVASPLAQAVDGGAELDPKSFYTEEEAREMAQAFKTASHENFSSVKELLGASFSYEKFHIYRSITRSVRRQKGSPMQVRR